MVTLATTMANNTSNFSAIPKSDFDESYSLSPTSKNILYVIYFVTFIVGTTTNASVIYIIGIKQRLVKRFDVYIVSLATADLMASVLIPCMTIHNLVTNDYWLLFGNGGCKFFTSIKPYTKLVSAMMLIAISIGRLRVIKSNLPIPQIRRRTALEALSVWVLSALFTVPRAFYFTLQNGHCHDPDFQARYGYYVLMEILLCILPVVAMVFIYTASGCFIMSKNIPKGNSQLSIQRRNQYTKMTKMFGVLVLVFLAFTAPYSIVMFVIYFKKHLPNQIQNEDDRVLLYLKHAFKVLLSIHYCINPYIYAKMHRSLGKHLKHIKDKWYGLKFRLSNDEKMAAEQKRKNSLGRGMTATKLEKRVNTDYTCAMETSKLSLDVEKAPIKRQVSDNSVSSFTMF